MPKEKSLNRLQQQLLRSGYPQSMVDSATKKSSYYKMEIETMAFENKVKRGGKKRSAGSDEAKRK